MIVVMCDAPDCKSLEDYANADDWDLEEGATLCPEHATPFARQVIDLTAENDRLHDALYRIWHIVRGYSTSPNVSVRILEILEAVE
jgi:hypothetical protein